MVPCAAQLEAHVGEAVLLNRVDVQRVQTDERASGRVVGGSESLAPAFEHFVVAGRGLAAGAPLPIGTLRRAWADRQRFGDIPNAGVPRIPAPDLRPPTPPSQCVERFGVVDEAAELVDPLAVAVDLDLAADVVILHAEADLRGP